MNMKLGNVVVALACVVVLTACDSNPEPESKQSSQTPSAQVGQNVFAAQYQTESTTWKVAANSTFVIPVTIKNTSTDTWSSQATKGPVRASYHWLDSSKKMLVRDGLRTQFATPVAAGSEVKINLNAQAPKESGTYIMQVSLVQEGVAWFENKQVKPLELTFQVE
jgi:hypothetical protein